MDLLLYIVCFILGSAGALVISRWGASIGVLDRANHRSSHRGTVPKGGGIGILAAFIFSAIVLNLPTAFWVSTTVVALFSFYGDKFDLSPKTRLIVQFLAAFVIMKFAVPQLCLTFPDPFLFRIAPENTGFFLTALSLIFFSVFMVGTANYYNFMDGINGIAGITGVVAFGLITLFCLASGENDVLVVLSVGIMSACLGFLPFNMPNAKVFMGDVGSILLGFLFAAIVVSLVRSANDFIVLSSFLFPFYADELSTAYVRIRNGENLLHPHRSHIYQILANEKGIAHWKVSVGYGLLQIFVGTSILAVRSQGIIVSLTILISYFAAFAITGHYLRLSIVQNLPR